MRTIVLGKTGITTPQNAFGALPIQRDSTEAAVKLLRKAYEGGMCFFDTARAYSDSEEKIGLALSDVRDKITIATKTGATDPEEMKRHMDKSLAMLRTDHVDIYQLHMANRCYAPGDGTGVYETMEDFKRQGMIKHIGITAHKIGVAEEAVDSGLYETLQFPFSYLSDDREVALVRRCKEKNVGFIAMKAIAGGLINCAAAAMAYIAQFDNVVPIWGVQRETELDEWLSFMDKTPALDEEMQARIAADKEALGADFCRGCGYCMPCPQGVVINQCARMSLMIRRAPTTTWFNEHWQAEMEKTATCKECGLCKTRCPYELDISNLLKKNYIDYKEQVNCTK